MDLKEIDSLLSVANEETYTKLEAEIARLTKARDIIGKILGKEWPAKKAGRGPTRTYRFIGRNSGLGQALIALADGPQPVSRLKERITASKSAIGIEIKRCPHARCRDDGLYELTELGRKWVEEAEAVESAA